MTISTELIEREIAALEQSEAVAAPYYLKAELRRRRASARNVGRPRAADTKQRQQWRDASSRYRNNKNK